jgi:hypothetical protein
MTYTVTLTEEQLFELLDSHLMSDEEGLEIVKFIDTVVMQDLDFTEKCAQYFIKEMAQYKDTEYWEPFVKFVKENIK